MVNLFEPVYILISMTWFLPTIQTDDLLNGSYTLQTKSGVIHQDDIISTLLVDNKLRCALICSRLDYCLLYAVSVEPTLNLRFYRCHFSRDITWSYDVSIGGTIYRHAYKEPTAQTTTTTAATTTTTLMTTEEMTSLPPCICLNGGTCSYEGSNPVCVCPHVFTGPQCAVQITECGEPPSDGISTSNKRYKIDITNQASEKIHIYRIGSSDLIQAISEGGGEWSTEDIKVGSRVYFLNEDEDRYLPMKTSDGTWHCWLDLPAKDETLTAWDSIN